MKKTMILFLSIITILISVAFALNKKSEEDKYYDNIELTSNSTHFFIKDSDISIDDQLSEFTSLSKKYNATFIRSDILTENGKTYIYKSGIYSTNYFDQLGIKLASGKIPASNNEFLANYNTEDNNQSGRISNMFSDKKLIFGTLQDFYTKNKMSVNGSYTLISESKDSDDILNQISTVFKIPKDELLKATYEQAYGQGTIYLLVLVLSIIIMAIFCLMSAFYPIAKLKEIGVMKLLGFKDIDIWTKLNKVILLVPALFYICTLPIQSFIIPDSNLSYFLELTLVELVVFVLAWVFSLVMLIIIRRYNLSAILKNFFNLKFSLYFSYLLKFFVFVAVVAVIPLLVTELNTLHKDLKAKDLYEQQKHYLTLSKFNYVDDEFQESLQGKGKLDSKLINLYKELDTSADIQYVSVSNINATVFNGAKINTSKFKDIEFDDSDDYLIMSANENYLKRIQFKLPTPSSKIYSETEMTYLVPEYLKKDFEKTEFFIRIQLASLLSDNSFENIEDIPIRFIFYPNNENEIFSENIEMIGNNKTFIKNPIIFCINNNTINTSSMFLKNSPLSNPLRIENTKENKLAISEAIINNNLENNSIQFENILSTGFAQELLISQSSVGIWITILCLTISVSVLASYYIILIILASKRKEMIVSRLLGYTFYDRYRNEIFYFFSIYIFGLIEIVILNKQLLSMLAYLLLVSIDIFIIFLMVTRYEKGTLSAGLKGGRMMSIINIKNFNKSFGDKVVFKDFNLEINDGDMVAITGPSGCGKTTLLNTIGLIEPVEQGEYHIFQKAAPKINSKQANKMIRENISYLFQNFALVDNFTIKENLLMALRYVKQTKKEKEELIDNALRMVGLENYQKLKVFEISGGEQQRVAIARCLLKPSKVILADEPTGSLDTKNRDEILAILNQLNASGKTIIIVTHDNKVAESCHHTIGLGV